MRREDDLQRLVEVLESQTLLCLFVCVWLRVSEWSEFVLRSERIVVE